MRSQIITLFLLATCTVARSDEPLRVHTYGAPGAMVYVTPQSVIGMEAGSSADVGSAAFSSRYCRGKAPLQLALKPGAYMVSVMPQADYSLRDAMMKAGEFVWDGYDYHAVVDLLNTRWRYAQCYLIEKLKDAPAEVLAVFTDQMPDGEALSIDLGKKTTRFTGSEEAGAEQLETAEVPFTYHEDILKGVQAGAKVLVREGAERFVITADGPEKLRVIRGHGSGASAAHRPSVCSGEKHRSDPHRGEGLSRARWSLDTGRALESSPTPNLAGPPLIVRQ
jgi:hypothetical protein